MVFNATFNNFSVIYIVASRIGLSIIFLQIYITISTEQPNYDIIHVLLCDKTLFIQRMIKKTCEVDFVKSVFIS